MSRQDANAAFARSSFLYGGNAGYIDDLYARFEDNPGSVDAGWQAKKPEDFKPVPYVTEAIDPFDIELKDDQLFWVEGEKAR